MLELQHISFRAEEEKEILTDISLTVDDRFVAITGPNGGGKSTLAKIIAGIYTPSEGRILLNGEDITDLSITERAKRGVSYAFQQPVTFKGLRVRDLLNIAGGGKVSFNESCEMLSSVGLCARDYIDRELDRTLSGGEMKRIEIATILARKTPVNIFDEPEAGIDLWSFQSLIKVFERMYDRVNGNILIISHQERILNIADKIIYLKGGRLEQYGPKDEILPMLLSGTASTCTKLTDCM